MIFLICFKKENLKIYIIEYKSLEQFDKSKKKKNKFENPFLFETN